MPKRLVKESHKEKHQEQNNKNSDSNNSLKKNKSFPVIRAVKSMQGKKNIAFFFLNIEFYEVFQFKLLITLMFILPNSLFI